MSYEQKYLKYKSKYLALKSQANVNTKKTSNNIINLLQLGGSSLLNKDSIEHLTNTPSLTEIWGGSFKNKSKDINNLVKLLTDSEDIVTTEFSLEGGSEQSDSETAASDQIESENQQSTIKQTETVNTESDIQQTETVNTESDIQQTDSDKKKSDSDSNSDSDKKSESEIQQNEPEQAGGKKKPNSYKKFFFEDSDLISSSTTSDSELSSFNTSTTENSDADL